jgi:nickel/cobalt exporter
MSDFTTLLQQGNAWIFIPSAILLGALHGLEPGHSKTMMAAFIVAVRGTLKQAILLGLAATVSHTAVVWAIAMAGMWFGKGWDVHTSEPYFQLVSAALILAIAFWMLWRTWQDRKGAHRHHHGHGHSHDRPHERSRLHAAPQRSVHQPAVRPAQIHFTTLRPVVALSENEYQDAHERAHAEQISQRFDGREVTTGQIVIFGLTGGLIPCPASIAILLICLQLKHFALGAALVLSFSVGLALTLVASGALAALSVRHVAKRWKGFGSLSRNAPFFSSGLIILVGLYMAWHGISGLLDA